MSRKFQIRPTITSATFCGREYSSTVRPSLNSSTSWLCLSLSVFSSATFCRK